MINVKIKRKKLIYTILAAAFWIALWQAVAVIVDMDYVLPSPVDTARALIEGASEKKFWSAVCFSVVRILVGFLASGVIGIFIALLSVKIKILKILFDPLCSVLRAVPIASFIILVLVMFASKNVAAIISFLMGFPLVYSSVSKATEVTPSEMLEVVKTFKMPFLASLRYVYIPHLRPYIASALTVSVGLCFKSGIAAEVIGYPMGSVGAQMYLAKTGMNMPDLFAYTVIVVLASVICEKVIARVLGGKREVRV